MSLLMLVTIYFISVVLPIVFWVWLILRADRKEPEPKRILLRVFRFGFWALLAAVLIEFFVDRAFFPDAVRFMSFDSDIKLDSKIFLLVLLSFFLAGPIEEILKYLALKWVVVKRKEFNQIADGVVYGAVLALGFAFVENTGYFFDALANLKTGEFVFVSITRGILTTTLHVVATGILGLFVARSKFIEKERQFGAYKGVAIASLIHGFYNVFAFFLFGIIVNVVIVLLSGAYLWREMKKEKVQKIWKTS